MIANYVKWPSPYYNRCKAMILHWLLLAIRYCSIVSLARAGFIDNSSKDGIVEATRYGYVYEGAGFIALMVSVVAGGWWLVVGAAGGGCGWWWVRLVVGAAGGGCGWWQEGSSSLEGRPNH